MNNRRRRKRKIRVLLVDDHPAILTGISRYLRMQATVNVIGQATRGNDALRKIDDLKPDVVVLDLTLPDIQGLEVVRRMTVGPSKPRFVVYTMHDGREYIRAALRVGLEGFVLKSSTLAELSRAIAKVQSGSMFMGRKLRRLMELDCGKRDSRKVDSHDSTSPRSPNEGHALTDRERTILRLMADGFVLKEIADRLGISYYTAIAHSKHIYSKLQIHTLGAAVAKALREGLF